MGDQDPDIYIGKHRTPEDTWTEDLSKSRPMFILFKGYNQPETLREVIFQGVGAASLCWENNSGLGVFDSNRAKALGDEILAWIHEHYELKKEYDVDEKLILKDRRPHCRACNILPHEHGPACHNNCQTCHGRPIRPLLS